MNKEDNDYFDDPFSSAKRVGASDEPRELIVMRAGGRLFAVYADEADNVTEGLRPTPLPGAPPATLGVVCVRGRMRTTLDPAALFGESSQAVRAGVGAHPAPPPRFIVSLRGDEQLALAVERVERIIEAAEEPLDQTADLAGPVRGVFRLDDSIVTVLDPERLFDAAMQGAERRRQRG
jgi:chemotaxis signal transduction protein